MTGKRTADHARRDRLVVEYYPMVRRIAGRMFRHVPQHTMDLSDLVSAGTLGLIDAASRYDPAQSDAFTKYAEWRIRGAILDDLRGRDPLSRDKRQLTKKIDAHYEDLSVKLGRRPTDEELASNLGMPLATLRKEKLDSINTVAIDIENVYKSDVLVETDDPEGSILRRETIGILKKLLKKMPERTRKIIVLHYFRYWTLKEIAKRVGVTESRVCQIHRETLRTFKAELGTALDLF